MRTLMMFASIVIVATGTFCIANSGVAFTSAAFVVGIALAFVGIVELIVNRGTVMRAGEDTHEINVEGVTSVVLAAVILSGQLYEDVAVTAIFAMWLLMDGLRMMSSSKIDIRVNSRTDNMQMALGLIMSIAGVYMFFNQKFLDLQVMTMVGTALFLLGLNRFSLAMAIEYRKPEFLTGNHEKLAEAKREEKRAMNKTKEGIRETQEIRRRISRLNRAIAREENMLSDAERHRTSSKGE